MPEGKILSNSFELYLFYKYFSKDQGDQHSIQQFPFPNCLLDCTSSSTFIALPRSRAVWRGGFYDGAMAYDLATQAPPLIDLGNYRDRPFTNEMGRMFGSPRFMAPE